MDQREQQRCSKIPDETRPKRSRVWVRHCRGGVCADAGPLAAEEAALVPRDRWHSESAEIPCKGRLYRARWGVEARNRSAKSAAWNVLERGTPPIAIEKCGSY